MKKLNYVCLILIFTFLSANLYNTFAKEKEKDKNKTRISKTADNPTQSVMDINNITCWIRDDGFHDPIVNSDKNGKFPKGSNLGAIFSEGIIWGGRVIDGKTPVVRVNGNTYRTGCKALTRLFRVRPDFQTANLTDDAANFFMVSAEEVTQEMITTLKQQYETDWMEWPGNIGAYYADTNGNGIYDPDANGNGVVGEKGEDIPGIPGASQTIFIMYNDDNSESLYASLPIGLEVRETYWAYSYIETLENVIYKKIDFVYKGTPASSSNSKIDSLYIVQWVDPDLGYYIDDFAGCDRLLNLGYAYNAKDQDSVYQASGFGPPAVGYDFLQGVSQYTGNPNDSAIYNLKWRKGYKYINSQPMSSFIYFASGGNWSDPNLGDYQGTLQFYNLMRGKKPRPPYPSAETFPSSVADITPEGTYLLDGDPVTGTGKLDGTVDSPGDRRIMVINGPFNIKLRDTIEVVIAQVAGLGNNNLDAVTKMKVNDGIAQLLFDQLFPSITVTVPTGGENWLVGSSYEIIWTDNNVTNVKIDYSTNNGGNWINIVQSTPSDGSYNWLVPNTPSTNCKVRISDASNSIVNDQSDAVFTIKKLDPPTIVTSLTSLPSFGDIIVGQDSTPQSYTVSGSSLTADINVSAPAGFKISKSSGSGYTNTLTLTQISGTVSETTIYVIFSPTEEKSYSDTIKHTSTGATTKYVTVTGSGKSTPVPIISISPTSLSFGQVQVNQTSSRTFRITNIGNASLEVSSIISSNSSIFSVNLSSVTIPPNQYQEIAVTFKPLEAITYNGTITIGHNAAINQSIINMSGTGYPMKIFITPNYSFPNATETKNYKIIGIPGDNNLPLAKIMSGSPGKENDWRAFWDLGAGNYIEYNNSTIFNFIPGRAFWVISKNQIKIEDSVKTVPLSLDNSYSIPVHYEWNLISNPFEKTVLWSDVKNMNSLTQPIHYYQSGSYDSTTNNFEPYKGYYFFSRTPGLSSIKIPYVSGTGSALPKPNAEVNCEIELLLALEGVRKSLVKIAFSDEASLGVDKLDIFSPPSQFCEINMALYNTELQTNYKFLQEDYRQQIADGQEYEIVIKNSSGKTLDLVPRGLDNIGEHEVFLMDKQLMKFYDLRNHSSLELKSSPKEKEYRLFIGTVEYILEKKENTLPTDFVLYQNFPNPFNPSTTIMFALPQQSKVSLMIYNILGEKVAEIIKDEFYEPGYHQIELDKNNLSSGIYIFRLTTENYSRSRKMILMK